MRLLSDPAEYWKNVATVILAHTTYLPCVIYFILFSHVTSSIINVVCSRIAPLYSLSVNSRYYRQALLGRGKFSTYRRCQRYVIWIGILPGSLWTLLPRILIRDIPLGKGCYSVIVPPNSSRFFRFCCLLSCIACRHNIHSVPKRSPLSSENILWISRFFFK